MLRVLSGSVLLVYACSILRMRLKFYMITRDCEILSGIDSTEGEEIWID